MPIFDFKYLKSMLMSILLTRVVVFADEQMNSRTGDDSTIATKQNLEGRMKRENEDGNDSVVVK